VNLAGWRFVLFALIGTAAIVLLSSIGVPEQDGFEIDAHTGARTKKVQTPAEALAEARFSGNARTALESVRKRRKEFPESTALLRLEAVLAAELDESPEVPLHHPDALEIERQRARAIRAREELITRIRAREEFSLESAVALLTRLDADDAIAHATEGFFWKLGEWKVNPETHATRPDELTAQIQHSFQKKPAEESDADLFLGLIRGYRAENRPRARLRWALRAFGTLPRSRPIVKELLGTYLERSRTLEAFVVVGAALTESPDSVELWRMRATYAGWQMLPHAEIEARKNILRFEDKREHHERIVTLYSEIGDPLGAVPHAEALARNSTDKQVLLGPVLLALDAGDTDLALSMLAKLADASDDPAWWREKIIHYASQDMRADRVISELDWLRKRYPDGDYEARLEGILRRRGRHEALADLLEDRLARQPDDREVEQELIQLRYTLGHDEKALALMRTRMERTEDPAAFYAAVPTYRSLGIEGVFEHARRLAASPRITPETTPAVLGSITPLLEDENYRRLSIGIARRHPLVPESREFLIYASDLGNEDDAGRAISAAKLAAEHPDDAGYLRAWMERAGWAGDLAGETAARERYLQLDPADLKNRRALADLYDAQNLPEKSLEQWRLIAATEGIESPAQLRLVDVLLATENIEEAMAILEKRATLPGATIDDQLQVGEDLFGKTHFDRALRFYDEVLKRDAYHPVALLREGQIKAWTNDPRGAIPLLERRLAATDEDAASVQFTLGECYWAIGETRKAKRIQQPSLEAFGAMPDRTVEQDIMLAKMLTRFGRSDEARPIFEHVITSRPDDVDLLLDYVDSLMTEGDRERARPLIDRARELRPQSVRAQRADGSLSLQEKRYEYAATTFADAIEKYGPDAGTESELGRARELSGDLDGALIAYRAAHALQPDNDDLEEELLVLEDELARLLHVNAQVRSVAQDISYDAWVAGSTLWKRGRTRVGALLGTAFYSGPAQAVQNGQEDVDTSILRLDFTATHRFQHRNEVGVGVTTFAGANGNVPIGLWAGANFVGERPMWQIGVRAWWNELFADPAAAAGLGGRSTGGFAQGELDIGRRMWIGGTVRYEQLSLEFADQSASDPRFVGSATLGWRILDGPLRVADPHAIGAAHMPGVVGAMLGDELSGRRRNMLSAWINAATYRVLGDAELSQLIPLGKQFDYITLAARFDKALGDEWGVMIEGYAGRELQEAQNVYGLGAGLGWRPTEKFELALVGAYGSALGRSNDEATLRLRLGLTWRW